MIGRSGTLRSAFIALTLVGALLLGCAEEPAPAPIPPPPTPRLVVLYVPCTVNKHYLQPYGEAVAYTPNLARFAAESAVLTSHRTESGVSGTAFASIFSGAQADRHGVFKHPRELAQELYLIFEAFRDAGFETYYWNAHPMARADLAYAQGVEPGNVYRGALRGGDRRFDALLKRLAADPSRRALVVTSFTVTHAPWDSKHMPAFRRDFPSEVAGLSPDEVESRHATFVRNRFRIQTDLPGAIQKLGLTPEDVARMGAVLDALYKSKVRLLDQYFGSMLEAIDAAGLREDSLVTFTADHGQQMDEGELFRWIHGPDLAPDVIDVPWLVRGAGESIPARRIDAVTRSIDVYPTLAGLSGIALPADSPVAGEDLSAAVRGLAPFPSLTAWSHGTLRSWSFFEPDLIEYIWASARTGDALYTWRRLDDAWSFDVQQVQGGRERRALDAGTREHREAGRELWAYRLAMIEAFRAENPDEAQSKEEELGRLREEEAEALRALGYIE